MPWQHTCNGNGTSAHVMDISTDTAMDIGKDTYALASQDMETMSTLK